MSEFLEGFAGKLKPSPDTADGADWALAEQNLPEHITGAIPVCLMKRAEITDPEDPEKQQMVSVPVMEVMNVLAWVMMRKINPVITIDEVAKGITLENRREILDDVWRFWTGEESLTDDEEMEVEQDAEANPPQSPASAE